MKSMLEMTILLSAALFSAAQTYNATPTGAAVGASSNPAPAAAPAPSLDSVLGEIQHAAQAANADVVQLRIDRWKATGTEKAQMQQMAESVHKNIAYAVPDLIGEVRANQGNVSSAFKLYHNVNVLFEYLNSLTDAAGSLGKSEEFDPLNRDTASLDSARQHLSAYIEQTAASLEAKVRAATMPVVAPVAQPLPTPKRIVVDDDSSRKKTVNTKKKRASMPPPQPSSTPN